jgi:hypothetical protein
MAIVAYFELPGMSQTQYEQTLKGLEDKGLGAPDGRLHHVAWNTAQGWRVLDIWESEEKLGKFAEGLIPIMTGTGATPAQPQIFTVHNIIRG